ncbi:N-formylglutamate amidohydrolase [Gymnodinialimonas sp. 2305UL16-5]|uniref:N-formylglutamate amidohydrolase n=1 Tax=Gymnodinialimonas mytili TaxID=3126503 RepID=UPI0030AF0A44
MIITRMGALEQHLDDWPWPAASRYSTETVQDVLLVCEHASAFIPPVLNDLNLSEAARYSHAAWDIGAHDLATALADQMSAPLILGAISRLVYDCNRPPEAADSIPAQSEVFAVPGNADLTSSGRAARARRIHDPFHATVAKALQTGQPTTCLVTIHSFTPIYHGQMRDLDIGYIFEGDDRLATAVLAQTLRRGAHKAALNEPYCGADGVTHTLKLHAQDRPHVMIEVRNDLIDTPAKAARIAKDLAADLQAARAEITG